MLLHRTSHRFASQHALEQERRLAWFAAPKHDDLEQERFFGNAEKTLPAHTATRIQTDIHRRITETVVPTIELAEQAACDRTVLQRLTSYSEDPELQQLLQARLTQLSTQTTATMPLANTRLTRKLETLLDAKNPALLLDVYRMLSQRLHDYDVNEVLYDPHIALPEGVEPIPPHGTLLTLEEYLREESHWLAKKKWSQAAHPFEPGDIGELVPRLLPYELQELASDLRINPSLPPEELRHIILNYASKARRQARAIVNDTSGNQADEVPPRTRLLHSKQAVEKQIDAVLIEKARRALTTLQKNLPEALRSQCGAVRTLPTDAIGHVVIDTCAPLIAAARYNESEHDTYMQSLLLPTLGTRFAEALTKAKNATTNARAKLKSTDPLHQHGLLQHALQQVENLERQLQGSAEEVVEHLFGAEALALEQGIDLARFLAPSMPSGSTEAMLFAKFASQTATSEDRSRLWHDYPLEKLKRLAATHRNPLSQNVQAELQEDAQATRTLTVENLPQWERAFTEVQADLQKLRMPSSLGGMPLLSHEVLQTLGVEEALNERGRQISGLLNRANLPIPGNITPEERPQWLKLRNESLQQAATLILQLQRLQRQLVGYSDGSLIRELPPEQFAVHNDGAGNGNFEVQTGIITLNAGSPPKKMAAVLHHELGHALLDVFVRKTGMLAGAFPATRQALCVGLKTQNEEEAMNKLRELTDAYNIPTAGKTQEEIDEFLLDELLSRYASWVRGGKPAAKEEDTVRRQEQPLFEALEQHLFAPAHEPKLNGDAFGQTDKLHETGLETLVEDSRDEEGQVDSMRKIENDIASYFSKISLIESFVRDHPNLSGITSVDAWISSIKNLLVTEVQDPFRDRTISEAQASKRMSKLEAILQEGTKEINKFKAKELDVSGAPATGAQGLLQHWNSINWLSINDIIETGKSAWEDLQRQWKVRRQKAQAQFGEMMTDGIPNNIPYFGVLKQEFKRRSNNTELEEVKQWKDGMSEFDSYNLLSLLTTTENKYQLRALIELLTEKGRMDWNDEGFWKVLNKLSNYSMPIEACRNNDVLRDQWLQKLITDVWSDKEHFYNWRRTNDSNYNGEMDKFKGYVDQLSNVGGGMKNALARMLELWDNVNEERAKGNSPEVPNDITPHKYEKIILYAIENGKMAMEDKLFYLVQGVANGLISIDRLRGMGGETGGVTNLFPVIDYFYAQNNTLPEIRALAKRLKEKDSPYKYGSKTTLWLHLDVLRNERVKQRISKATSRGALEKIDHEDIPTIITTLSWNDVGERMLDVISGSRQQLSPEAQKNAYVGFGTKFKTLAVKARLHKERKARFTTEDAYEFARTMATSIHYDNLLTKNSIGGKGRPPHLTWDDINNTSGPSMGNGYRVKDVRDGNGLIMGSVLDALSELSSEKKLDLKNIFQEDKVRREDAAYDAKTQLFRRPSDESRRSDAAQKANYENMGRFADELSKKCVQNIDTLIDALAKHADPDHPELQPIPENQDKGDDDISKDSILKFIEAQNASRAAGTQTNDFFILKNQ